jgi:hypothetical protein
MAEIFSSGTMSLFKSQRHNDFRCIMRLWLVEALIVSTPLLLNLLFPWLHIGSRLYWYIFLPTVLIMRFIGLCLDDRVNEIIIDTNLRAISFKYYDVNQGQVLKSYPFEAIRLDIVVGRTLWGPKPITICFLKGKREVMSVSKTKDGFSMETLEDLKLSLQSLTSPVERRNAD